MSSFRLGCLSLAFLGLLILVACGQSESPEVARTEGGTLRLGPVEAVDTVSRAVAPKGRPLVIEGFRGSVVLRGADESTATLSLLRRGRGEDVEAARSVVKKISVRETGTVDAYTFALAPESDQLSAYAAVDIQGSVPRTTTLRIDRLSGPVQLDGVEGPLTIQHEHGSVWVDGAGGPVEVNITNGDVYVGFQTVPGQAPISLRTVNGNVDLGLPPDASVEIDARTNVGPIRTRGLSLTDESFTPLNAGARYTARMGTGAASVTLRTENGAITIQAPDTIRRDAPHSAPDTPVVPPSDTTVLGPPLPDDTASGTPDPTVRDPDTVEEGTQ